MTETTGPHEMEPEATLLLATSATNQQGDVSYSFITNMSDNVKETAGKLWHDMQEAYPHMKEGFVNCMKSVGTALDPKTAPDRIRAALASVGSFFNDLKEAIQSDKRPIGEKIRGAWDSFTKMVSGVCEEIAKKTKPTLDAAGTKFAEAWDATKESRLGKGVAAAYEQAKAVSSTVAGKISEAGKRAYDSIPGKKPSPKEMEL